MDIDYKDQLTNEQLLKRFKNQFELVRYAIQLAENTIRSGREPEMLGDSQNVAYNILGEIAHHREQFIELPKEEVEEQKKNDSKKHDSGKNSFQDEVRAFKEERKERKPRAKAAR